MSGAGDEGLLVGSGGFKVDRAHALRKLERYQLPGNVGGWLAWARCAAAGGATEVRCGVSGSEVSLTFAGRPFLRADLEDPFAPLFVGRRADGERGALLAMGLLQALACGPREVAVASGAGRDRVTMTARSLSDVSVLPTPGPETGTVLRVVWPFGSESRARFLSTSYVMLRPVPLLYPERLRVVGDLSLPPWPDEAQAARAFRLGGAQGRLRAPSFLTPPDSHLCLFKLGVFVCEHRELFPWAKVQGWVNDDRLSLSASQTGVAPDARFKGLMRLVSREAEAMLREAAAAHPAAVREARAEMAADPGARAVWDLRMKWGPQAGAAAATPSWWRTLLVPGTPKRYAAYRRVLESAERSLWLKDAAARLAAPGRTPPAALAKAVSGALAAAQGAV